MHGVGMALREEEEEGEGQKAGAEDWPRETLGVYVSASAFVDDCGFWVKESRGGRRRLSLCFGS